MYVIKFYDAHTGTIPYAQIDDFVEVSIKADITDYSTAEIILPSSIQGIEAEDKIEICSVGNTTDTVVYSGYVDDIEGGINTTKFHCHDEKYLLKKKLVVTPVSATQNLSTTLTTLVNAWNTASGDTLSFSIDTDFSVKVDVRAGDNLFGFLDDILKNTTPVRTFTLSNNQIKIKEYLGIDRSSPGSNYFCAYYRKNNPQDSNIIDLTSTIQNNTANILYSSSAGVLATDPFKISQFGPLGVLYSDSKGSDYTGILSTQYGVTKSYNYKISPDFLKIYGSVKIVGDKIYIDVDAGQYSSYQGVGYILTEDTVISRTGIEKTITVGPNYLKKLDMAQQILSNSRKIFLRTL